MPKLVKFSEIDESDERKLDPEYAYRERFWDVERSHYQNRQWAVTDYGIENISGPYHYYIERAALEMKFGSASFGWPDHMASKNWVDTDAFNDVWIAAISHFGRGAA